MVFSSLVFLYLYLPLTVFLYYVTPRRWRNPVLLVMSLLFYGWGEPKWIVIMLFSSVLDFCCSNTIERNRDKPKVCKGAVAVSAILNLSVLCFFKYTGLLVETIPALSALNIPEVSLPIGISFYTFQTMSCTIDVYRGEAKAQKNLIDFATYVTLFPQLIAGPIVRYQQIADQLTGRKETLERVFSGVCTFCVGLCKKVLLANSFGALWDQVQGRTDLPALTAAFGLLCFTFQIYFDFSGYSDMAIGLGRMFGFEFPVNFNYPYISKSVTEFWRRWHITLGTWFREYVYIPLGGNRGGTLRMLRNIFVVWFLTGLWHGASWNFALWGLFYGIILLFEKVLLKKPLEKAPAWLCHVYTMVLVMLGWALFSFTDLSQLGIFLKGLFGANGFADRWVLYQLVHGWPLLVAGVIGCTPLPKRLWMKALAGKGAGTDSAVAPIRLGRFGWAIPVLCAAALLVCTAYLVNAGFNPFLYFRF